MFNFNGCRRESLMGKTSSRERERERGGANQSKICANHWHIKMSMALILCILIISVQYGWY